MTRLSNRQYPLLETFATGVYMSIEDAQLFDQRPFRSMLIRKWVAYKPGRGFHITTEGRAAREEFLHTDIGRKDPSLPLTAYFDPTAYGLRVPAIPKRIAARGAKLHVMRSGSAGAA
jgi:hypothetical protein